ncbi:hypothetical protein [Sulfurospirillum barnesii]|uniref:Uncharacterized protein n=1 Tax=Sulfurospirillum barnesii (strain ATCC 700032 / DSM 10660 / SES-3) TaxID=760154 RepID=I3Y069_SULBS|nr:hypothetical protein [Sulfurospirillum barnesii]AFL69593.1 hypothetical protein Sulba_2323 [Sulfurospirillum barnesii SES-3]
MGYVVRNGKVQQARRVSGLTPGQKKELFQQTPKQQEVITRLLAKRECTTAKQSKSA